MKAAGIDIIAAEMLKCGGDVVTKCMVNICQVAWKGGGASKLDKSHRCPSIQREGPEGGVWEL